MAGAISGYRVGIDVGGTFTDLVLSMQNSDLLSYKVLTTPRNPVDGILKALGTAAESNRLSLHDFLNRVETIVYSSTIAANALLTGAYEPVGLITTKGFRDVLEIRRAGKEKIYDLKYRPPKPLVPRFLRLGVEERTGPEGNKMTELSEKEVVEAMNVFHKEGLKSFAVCFLHSYSNPSNEKACGELIRRANPRVYLSLSHEILPEIGIYERLSTTVVNSCIGPLVQKAVAEIENKLSELGFKGTILIMASNGGMMSSMSATKLACRTLLAGPGAGATAGTLFSGIYPARDTISMDMGGTTCLVTMLEGGLPTITNDVEYAGYIVALPSVDIRTIGAGGGSIAWVDEGGILRVGPHSASSDPGPVCYGLGGKQPTVTDADLVLGLIDPLYFLGGDMPLKQGLAEQAIEEKIANPLGLSVKEAAYGIFSVVNSNMSTVVREISIGRGVDPRDTCLIIAGGAGPIHGCVIAHELEIPLAIIPRESGSYTALGLLGSDVRHDFVRIHRVRTDSVDKSKLKALFDDMVKEGSAVLSAEGFGEHMSFTYSVDVRYAGQFHQVNVSVRTEEIGSGLPSVVGDFNKRHDQLYGYSAEGDPAEILALRVQAIGVVTKIQFKKFSKPGKDATSARIGERKIYDHSTKDMITVPMYDAMALRYGNIVQGPSLIRHPNSTINLIDNYDLACDLHGNFVVFHQDNKDKFMTLVGDKQTA